MTTIREEAFDLLRALGLTTIFGNPGSTELPFLQHFPDDFTYVLALQEASVVAMADGFAQASGHAALVNLHTAPGVGNAMGSIITAYQNRTPLVITAGQQVRAMMALEPLLFARDAIELPKPYVKWSYEPVRAQDVPMALARAYFIANQHPRGPVFLSLPMDDWNQEATEPFQVREVSQRTAPDPLILQPVAEVLASKQKIALVVGAEADRADAWEVLVALAERLVADVWAAPLANRKGFPEHHPLFRGDLPPIMKSLSDKLANYDAVMVVGAPVFLYYPYVPGPILKADIPLIHLSNDPDEAARAPIGTSVVADIALSVEQLLTLLPTGKQGALSKPLSRPAAPPAQVPITPAFLMHTLAGLLPENFILVDESPSTQSVLHKHIPITSPVGWYLTGSGGLGFGMPAAVGIQMAQPERRVVCTLGDGSSMYSIQALWTAARYNVPVVFVVLRNSEYAILKAFANFEQVNHKLPGLDLPNLDIVQVAQGFGCQAWRVEQPTELAESLQRALQLMKPVVIEVVVDAKNPSLL
ncbi:MAG: benzoylformate decarboxylase [Ktedonobacteraceae bacterium]